MSFLVLWLFAIVSGEKATDICLPVTHETFVATRRWAESESAYSHNYAEYNEGDFIHVWSDGVTRKTLVHSYEWDYYKGHEEDHYDFSLRDYQKKYHWIGHWNFTTQTLTHCRLELFEPDHRQWGPYCLVKGANKRGSGTVGENTKVDFWEARYRDDKEQFEEEIDVILEAGTTNLPLQERVYGSHFNKTEQKTWYWSEHREFFDFKEDAIPASAFAVPVGCPNP